MGPNAFAKSIDPCQPAQSAQGDMGRNFLLSLNFLLTEGSFYLSRFHWFLDRLSGCNARWRRIKLFFARAKFIYLFFRYLQVKAQH